VADFTQDLFSSRRNYADGNVRLGEKDRLWYDSITNTIRIGDGVTPGGQVISAGGGQGNYSNANVASYLPVYGGNIALTAITSNTSTWTFSTDGNLAIPGNINYANGINILYGVNGAFNDIDGGYPNSIYGGISNIDAGGVV